RPIGATHGTSSTSCAATTSPRSGYRIPPRAICGPSSRTGCAWSACAPWSRMACTAIALNYQLVRGAKLLRQAGLSELQALALPPHTARRRDQSVELLRGLTTQIQELDEAITAAALAHPDAPRLITHPGVGALTALATIVVLGPVARFHDSK